MVELLIALSLMFVGLMGMMSLQIIAQRATQQSRAMTEALALAQDRLERSRRLPLASIAASTETRLDAQGASGSGQYTRTTTATTSGTNVTVRVDVQWTDAAAKGHTITLRTVRAP